MTDTVVERDPILDTDFIKEMARQMRALDTYGTYQGWTVEKILDPYIMTKERKAEIPLVGDPDDVTISRVKAFYNAIAVMIEKECKLLAVPVVSGDPAIYFPLAMPVVMAEGIALENRTETPIVVTFDALPDATGRCYYVAPISRLTL